jgi:hypothetical protein
MVERQVRIRSSSQALAGFARLTGFILAGILGMPMSADAQSFADLRAPDSPLVLQALGSFYVGGRTVSASTTAIGLYRGGPMLVDQMYVQYMIPLEHTKPPIVTIHGATLTGKTYETTPDGRIGWYEYFARRGFPSYVVDQVGRARSGFDQTPFNDVRSGVAAPASQRAPPIGTFVIDVYSMPRIIGIPAKPHAPNPVRENLERAPGHGHRRRRTAPDRQNLPP